MMKTFLLCGLLVVVLCLVGSEGHNKVVCYYGSWAVYRHGAGKFDVENIDPHLCTHLIFGFAGLDASTNAIIPLDPYNELEENWGRGAYARFNKLREKNPALKTLIAIGGWNEGSVKYSKMAANPSTRRAFINSVISFLQVHKFDGLDLDWEYPANRGGEDEDKRNFVILLKEVREEFDKYGWLLTAAVSAGKATIDSAYDVPGVAKYLHFINVMAYDFHGAWETISGHNAPLYARPDESDHHHLLTVNYSINYWLSQGASREQIILGMGLYGRSFTLQNPSLVDPGNDITGPGLGGPFTNEPGTIGYNEICVNLPSWTVVQDPYYKAPYAYKGNQWVGYDDPESIRVKTEFAKSLGLGGGMVWSVETDDFQGTCHGTKFPLLSVINRVLNNGNPVGTFPPIHTRPPTIPTVSLPPSIPPPTGGEVTEPPKPSVTQPPVVATTGVHDGKCKRTGYHRDPIDCSKFYYCQVDNGKLTVISEQHCPDGLVYDIVDFKCKWPVEVDCNLPNVIL